LPGGIACPNDTPAPFEEMLDAAATASSAKMAGPTDDTLPDDPGVEEDAVERAIEEPDIPAWPDPNAILSAPPPSAGTLSGADAEERPAAAPFGSADATEGGESQTAGHRAPAPHPAQPRAHEATDAGSTDRIEAASPQEDEQPLSNALPRAALFLSSPTAVSRDSPVCPRLPAGIEETRAAYPTDAPQPETARQDRPPLASGASDPFVSAAVPLEVGQPAGEPLSGMVAPSMMVEMRDQPIRVTEAPALHRPFATEPHRQIADAIVRTRDGQVEVILNPVELGRVTVLLGAEGNPGHLALFVERPETLDLIRRHGDQLLRELRDGGMPDPSLDILQQDSRNHPRDRGQRPGQDWRGSRDLMIDSAREPAPRVISLSRLDIRL